MTTDDALKRLQSGLDRDERIARAATKLPQPVTRYPEKRPPWEAERWEADRLGDLTSVNGENPLLYGDTVGDASARDADTAAHMATWDPKRALGIVEAIRKVIAEREAEHTRVRASDPTVRAYGDGYRAAYDRIASILASIYTPEPEKS